MTAGRQSRFGQWAGVPVSQGSWGIAWSCLDVVFFVALPPFVMEGDTGKKVPDEEKNKVPVKRPQPRSRPLRKDRRFSAPSLPPHFEPCATQDGGSRSAFANPRWYGAEGSEGFREALKSEVPTKGSSWCFNRGWRPGGTDGLGAAPKVPTESAKLEKWRSENTQASLLPPSPSSMPGPKPCSDVRCACP